MSNDVVARTFRAGGSGFITLDAITWPDGGLMTHWPGGTLANILCGLSFLGWHTLVLGRIGTDVAGDVIVDALGEQLIDVRGLVRDCAVETPRIVERITLDGQEEGTHTFSMRCPNCGKFLPRFRSLTVKAMADLLPTVGPLDVFIFDRCSPAILHAARHFRSLGSVIFFEPNGVGDDTLFVEAIKLAHIVKYSNQRIGKALTTKDGVRQLVGAPWPLLEVETLGAQGLRFRTPQIEWVTLPALRVAPVVDTCGAGDWCSVGLLHSLLRRSPSLGTSLGVSDITQALTWGQALAGLQSAYVGAQGMARSERQERVLELAQELFNRGEILLAPPQPDQGRRPGGVAPPAACSICLRN